MKYTLLEIVQDVLNDMDSDFVNSIDDTVESQQVAQIAKSCFNEMMSNRNWPHLRKLMKMDASGTPSRPTHMRVPDDVKEVDWIRYDCRKFGDTRPDYRVIKYKEPNDFLTMVHARNLDNDNVISVQDQSATPILIYNDRAPLYWTTFDDDWVVFDSYDVAIDDTLKNSKTQIQAYVEPVWSSVDSFVPDLPDEAFAAFVEETKSTAFLVLKQMANEKAEQKSKRQQRWLSRKAWKVQGGINYPSYGRTGKK